jgi:A/G-specific adenine glycosylase
MLQQTQASRVAPAYRSFLERYPTVVSLAAASRADVLRAWGTLGYPRRAVALSEAAKAIVATYGGVVPRDPAVLVQLPGVGPYTAAAVAALGYGTPVPALDTNVRRVVRRVVLGSDDAPRGEVDDAARRWLDRADPGGWNQALMDLGRTHCGSRPRCGGCPLARACRFRSAGAVPAPTGRRQAPFEGSTRQLRGTIVRTLRDRPSASLASLARASARPIDGVTDAVRSLHDEGIVTASAAALDGAPRARVRLAR